MSDLIDRQAAIDAVNRLSLGETDAVRLSMRIADYLNRMPSAQPEITRCKDCKHQEKHFHTDGRRKGGGYYIYGCELAEEYSHVCLDDDFCSRAERRTDE